MYDIVKNVIISGDFRLSDMQTKIDTLWVQGDLTEDERNELIANYQTICQTGIRSSRTDRIVKQLLAKYESLDERVTKLENGGVTPEPPTGVEIPVWEPWDGISDQYQYGAVVTVDQKYYISVHQGQNTWMPGSMGTEGTMEGDQ